MTFAVEPKTHSDEENLGRCTCMFEADPNLHYIHDPDSRAPGIRHRRNAYHGRAIGRNGVDVKLKPPKIPYRETISARSRSRPNKETDRWPRPVRGHPPEPLAAARTSSSWTLGGSIRSQARSREAFRSRDRGFPRRLPGGGPRHPHGGFHPWTRRNGFKLAGAQASEGLARPTGAVEPIIASVQAGDSMGTSSGI